jgi:hypothetical protein
MLERCALRNGNVHSADGWRDVLDPVIARYAGRDLGGRFFRADAAYAIPGDCQEFRVRPGIMGMKEISHGPTQGCSNP